MSQETSKWLNTMTLRGFTEKLGKAWHYRKSDQGAEPNHYEGPIPAEDVRRRLFSWEPVTAKMQATIMVDGMSADGQPVKIPTLLTSDDRIVIVHPDTHVFLGAFKSGFRVHPYDEWLITQLEAIADSDLGLASAGLLKGGAVAWVQAQLPETITVAGYGFRPFYTAATSLDGSLSSTYLTGAEGVVCDNTLSAALGSATTRVKIKHSSKSLGKLGEVRERLGLVHEVAEEFAERLDFLTGITVTDKQWSAFLTAHLGELPAEKGRARTIALGKQDDLRGLWDNDMRVAPWSGTAFGVLQAVNTADHHLGTVRNMSRPERNMAKMVAGDFDKLDHGTLVKLGKVLDLQLV